MSSELKALWDGEENPSILQSPSLKKKKKENKKALPTQSKMRHGISLQLKKYIKGISQKMQFFPKLQPERYKRLDCFFKEKRLFLSLPWSFH